MSWSLVETKTLATKAARGAGFAWGLAEEAGFAVHWLQSHGAPGVAALAALLDWQSKPGNAFSPAWTSGNTSDPVGTFSPIELGTALMDAGSFSYTGLGQVRQPLLLAPFLSMNAPERGCRLNWGDVSIVLAQDCFNTSATRQALLADVADCFLSDADEDGVSNVQHVRVGNDEADSIETLKSFAAATFAPATEASRLSGAGAGLTDND